MTPLARATQLGGIIVLRPWLWLCFGLRVRRHAPRPTGAVLYAANHRSFADPALAALWSTAPVAFFAKASLWKTPAIRVFLDIFGGIPVERANPSAASLTAAVERLRAGWPVLVFPEGTRTRTGRLGALRDGPALIARRAGVAVVPIYLHCSESVWPRGWWLPAWWGRRVEIIFGPALIAPLELPPRQRDAWLTRRLDLWLRHQERCLTARTSAAPRAEAPRSEAQRSGAPRA